MNKTRREFLAKMLSISVLSATCPHMLLGKITPELRKDGDVILGRYVVNLNDYPVLKELWGSVRILIPPEMTHGFFAPIVITRIDPWEYGQEFSCLYTLCPHEGREIYDFEPEYRQFKCSGHGTIFDADGTYMAGPAAQDLTKYRVHRDGEDYIYMDIPAVKTDVFETDDGLAYIKSCEPNPCIDTARFDYGVENDSIINFKIFNAIGREVLNIENIYKTAGHYTQEFNTSSLKSGVYILKFEVQGGKSLISKFAVVK